MPERRVLSTTVLEADRLTPSMVRVVVGGPDLAGFAVGSFTDHYVKCRFGDKTRSYTVREWDAAEGRLTLDFVVHGDRGVAGPWAARARPGDTLELSGPGGAYAPSPQADWHLLVGDDAALPAIAASLCRMPAGVPAFAVVEVDGPEHRQELHSPAELQVTWLYRSAGPGEDPSLQLEAVKGLKLPVGQGQAFVHGEATTVRLIRRHLLVERSLPLEWLSASGYWKLRRTDEEWRAEKREWMAQAEADLVGQAPTDSAATADSGSASTADSGSAATADSGSASTADSGSAATADSGSAATADSARRGSQLPLAGRHRDAG